LKKAVNETAMTLDEVVQLGGAPLIWDFSVIQTPDKCDQRAMAVIFGPFDGFRLRAECRKCLVGMLFDYIVVDWLSVSQTFGPGFDINICHDDLLLSSLDWQEAPNV
jgi:hypothetical protein